MTDPGNPKKEDSPRDCWNRIGIWGDSRERCPELAVLGHCRNCSVYSHAGRRLLERPISEEDRSEWTVAFARPPEKKIETIRSAFVFRAGGEWLGLPAGLIEEVVDMGKIHTLPHKSNNVLRGLVNIRGKLEICFSIGAILGIDRFEKPEIRQHYMSPERLVVVAREGQRVVFPVSEVYGTYRFSEGMLQQLPITVAGSKAAFSKGILCIEDFDVGFLDDKILFDTLMRYL